MICFHIFEEEKHQGGVRRVTYVRKVFNETVSVGLVNHTEVFEGYCESISQPKNN